MNLFKRKLDNFYIDVYVKDRKGLSRGRHVEVTKMAHKQIHEISTHSGQIIRVEISNVR